MTLVAKEIQIKAQHNRGAKFKKTDNINYR